MGFLPPHRLDRRLIPIDCAVSKLIKMTCLTQPAKAKKHPQTPPPAPSRQPPRSRPTFQDVFLLRPKRQMSFNVLQNIRLRTEIRNLGGSFSNISDSPDTAHTFINPRAHHQPISPVPRPSTYLLSLDE